MKKILLLLTVALGANGVFAWHHPCWHHHHSYGGGWAAVGAGFAAGVVGAALYDAVAPRRTVVVQQPAPIIVPQPVVVQQPAPIVVQQPAPVVVQQQPTPVVVQQPASVVVQQQPTTVVAPRQQVWVSGRYVQQIQANGTAVTVWQPGHYE